MGVSKGWAHQNYLWIPMPATISSSILDSLSVGGGKKNLHMFWRVSQVVSSKSLPPPLAWTAIQEDCYEPSSNWEEGVTSTTVCRFKLHSYSSWPAHLCLCWSLHHGEGPDFIRLSTKFLTLTQSLGLQGSEWIRSQRQKAAFLIHSSNLSGLCFFTCRMSAQGRLWVYDFSAKTHECPLWASSMLHWHLCKHKPKIRTQNSQLYYLTA